MSADPVLDSLPSADTAQRHSGDLIAALRAPAVDHPKSPPRTTVVVAHPDDETVGAGSRLPRLAQARFLYVTDGAPRDGRDAARYGLSPAEYAGVRRRELQAALALCAIRFDRVLCLGYADQEAALHMAELAHGLVEIFAESRAEAVLTHPYEGGHPDHDATAFAVHAAAALMRRRRQAPPGIVELASYHIGPHGIRPGAFLPDAEGDGDAAAVQLTVAERQRKSALFACFATQQETLRQFPIGIELFRPSPRYDFLAPPHASKLYYECHAWGMTGARFRALAGQAMAQLRLEGRL